MTKRIEVVTRGGECGLELRHPNRGQTRGRNTLASSEPRGLVRTTPTLGASLGD